MVHAGSNDTTLQQSELIKSDFIKLLSFLSAVENMSSSQAPSPQSAAVWAVSAGSLASTPGCSLPVGFTTWALLTTLICFGTDGPFLGGTESTQTFVAHKCLLLTSSAWCRHPNVTDYLPVTDTPLNFHVTLPLQSHLRQMLLVLAPPTGHYQYVHPHQFNTVCRL